MTLVQNLQQRLNGSKFLLFFGILFILFFTFSCTPRSKIIESKTEDPTIDQGKDDPKVTDQVEEVKALKNIVLMLPFQLNRSTGNQPSKNDVTKAELALDFYQGFQLGIENAISSSSPIKVTVLDSRDQESEVLRLSSESVMADANLIIGPVYPKEIKAFSSSQISDPKRVLRVSPLAATMPNEFNISNLVSITSPIITHIKALADRLVSLYKEGDVILLYQSEDAASKQFLPVLRSEILQLNSSAYMLDVHSEDELKDRSLSNGNNYVVVGSTNHFRITNLISQLQDLQRATGHRVQLFGHPNWAKMSFTNQSSQLESLLTEVSSTYYVDPRLTVVRDFNQQYKQEFTIEPSEFSYKGYDIGYYFGILIAKYKDGYASKLIEEKYKGLHNDFEFEYHPQWGYINTGIHFLRYRSGQFTRTN